MADRGQSRVTNSVADAKSKPHGHLWSGHRLRELGGQPVIPIIFSIDNNDDHDKMILDC